MTVRLMTGDCRELMATLDAESVSAIVTDPPYDLTNRVPDVKKCRDCGRVLGGRDGKPDTCPKCGGQLHNQRSQGKGFMGKDWDSTGIAFDPATWVEALRVLKPGGHLLAFSGTRTQHRMVCAIEDAGFEIRDTIGFLGLLGWVYASGFPKGKNVSKEFDKLAGFDVNALDWKPTTDLAKQWDGWNVALKPAWEPITLARKPLAEKSIAANVARYGTGGLNIAGCRIEVDSDEPNHRGERGLGRSRGGRYGGGATYSADRDDAVTEYSQHAGRWPANVCLDEDAAAMLDAQSGERTSGGSQHERSVSRNVAFGEYTSGRNGSRQPDTGGASRFFYCAKASSQERNLGLETPSTHPTVKPVSLMRWLVRLICPPGGVVLDPFAGSGSTGVACVYEELSFIGIEQSAEYVEIARRRIEHAQGPMFAAVEVV